MVVRSSFFLLLFLLPLFGPAKLSNPVPIPFHPFINPEQGQPKYSLIDYPLPRSNRSAGWPYPGHFIRPRSAVPSHVMPVGCAWYSHREENRQSCDFPTCPADSREIIRGMTLQRTHLLPRSWCFEQSCMAPTRTYHCPRQRGVPVPATLCCKNEKGRVFARGMTIGKYQPYSEEAWTSDCQWFGGEQDCFSGQCSRVEWRHEVARASSGWTPIPGTSGGRDTTKFGPACERGQRILCCRESAFRTKEATDELLNTELNYLFPIFLRKKSQFAGKSVIIVFRPGASPPTSSSTSTMMMTTTATNTTAETALLDAVVGEEGEEGGLVSPPPQ